MEITLAITAYPLSLLSFAMKCAKSEEGLGGLCCQLASQVEQRQMHRFEGFRERRFRERYVRGGFFWSRGFSYGNGSRWILIRCSHEMRGVHAGYQGYTLRRDSFPLKFEQYGKGEKQATGDCVTTSYERLLRFIERGSDYRICVSKLLHLIVSRVRDLASVVVSVGKEGGRLEGAFEVDAYRFVIQTPMNGIYVSRF